MVGQEFIKSKKFLILLSIFISIIGIVMIFLISPKFFPKVTIDLSSEFQQRTEKPQVDFFAPDFKLKDLNDNEVSILDKKGKVVLLTFWTSWHPLAQEQIKILESFNKNNKDPEISVLPIASAETKIVVSNFLNQAELSLQVLLDTTGKISDLYKIGPLPVHFFINKEGKIKEIHIGVLGEGEIVEKLNKIKGI